MNKYTTLCNCPEVQGPLAVMLGQKFYHKPTGKVMTSVEVDREAEAMRLEEDNGITVWVYDLSEVTYLPSTGDLLDMLGDAWLDMVSPKANDGVNWQIIASAEKGKVTRIEDPDRKTALLRAWMHLKHGKTLTEKGWE